MPGTQISRRATMSCELYWRDRILHVERGESDPHRDGCTDCQREHLAREEIIRALPFVAADEFGDSDWQARGWVRVARQERAGPATRWFLGSMMATACVLVVASWMLLRDRDHDQELASDGPEIEVTAGPVASRSLHAARSSSAGGGEQVRNKGQQE